MPYEDIIKMRLEDGIDVTRKEDYLSVEDFSRVFGMDRQAYEALPAWKRQRAKKTVNLF